MLEVADYFLDSGVKSHFDLSDGTTDFDGSKRHIRLAGRPDCPSV
jgi:hypothetical protein